jgi:hypothetical protein
MGKRSFSNFLIKKLSIGNTLFDKGLAPWFKWESENSSFGLCFRLFGFYPKFLPLFINSDHGVHWESKIWPNEKFSSPFITWNYRKFLNFNKLKVEAYYLKHPWIFYKENIFFKKKKKINSLKKGTIVFFPHSNTSTKPNFNNLNNYFKLLKNLPEKYKPISLMLFHLDISRELHVKLRKFGFNIVTAGHSSSVNFVKRFYDLISLFKYATSPMSEESIPSALFYCVDFRLPYFFLGKVKWMVHSHSAFVKKGNIKASMYGDQVDIMFLKKFNKLFYYNNYNNELSREKKNLVAKYLGIDSKISRYQFSFILWKSFFKNLFNLNFFILYFCRANSFFNKLISAYIKKRESNNI